ncbi:2-dehydro-3-deoxygalactonokinase [Xanthomonas maliensis]|uniref:2-dehydro-3-deoxygalactonokinase n=1 Tax=Xanthomonas maliensis TaxID=1321368 RepID=UPI0003A8A389|nr:2-dehydro-3-deoxygalactonokinase [Xanthomonas maliensis]KAB7772429.1 MFS transporter [Xanthomonas maliensis]
MIAIDWGTSSLRGYLLDAGGRVREQRRGSGGILASQGRFAEVLATLIDGWDGPLLLAGMIGSRNGWVEQPYLPCPVDSAGLAQAMQCYDDLLPGRTLWFVPGICTDPQAQVPDVMRGEETQLVGLLDELGAGVHTVCLPGTHSKWARLHDGRLDDFATVMTGELYAVLRQHSLLGKLMADDDGQLDAAAFLRGVARSAAPGGLGHHLFGARTLGLFEQLRAEALPSYLSGLLIGDELRSHAMTGGRVHLVGGPALTQRYALALEQLGVPAQLHAEELTASGLYALARQRGLA